MKMKKYILPQIKLVHFDDSVTTAASDVPKTNGADIAEGAMSEKRVSVQKVDMEIIKFQ